MYVCMYVATFCGWVVFSSVCEHFFNTYLLCCVSYVCRTLSEASHVIMDEVHERNISSDFLTIIMKDLLIKRSVTVVFQDLIF